MIKNSVKKHRMVEPKTIFVSPGVYTTDRDNIVIGHNTTTDTFWYDYENNTQRGAESIGSTTPFGANRVTYIDNYDHGYETVTISRETTLERFHGSGISIDDVREHTKYDMARELASKLILDDLVEIEERTDPYGRTRNTIMRLKVKRNN